MKTSFLEIKKSKFFGFLFEVNSKEEILTLKNKLLLENKKSTHICYGYVIKNEGQTLAGFSDDNEPNGTAGRPLRDLLLRKNEINKIIFVIRYFGGIKLGIGGLTRAYLKTAAILFDN